MRTPDARPCTEGAGETRHPDAALIDAVAMQIDADLLVGRSPVEIARSTVAAIRAALLRDAPVVWVATNQDASAWFHARPVHYAQDEYDGEWRWVEDQPSGGYYPAPSWLVEALGLVPGECARVRITKLDEEPTRT